MDYTGDVYQSQAAASAGAGGWVVAALGRGVVFGIEATALRMNVIQIVRDHWVHILVPMGFVLGCYLDRKNDEKLTAFRNKSLLFKRELRPNEEVTWK
uniref:NADH dehydrogenase [ubiquinone] 1 beta subcomplex subunit 1 n=1 Tax=Odobenus rosmarus divergens TaxID=9708 RepID=UPI00063CA1C7|nr:PREDICTED: NADH dehydrogenase [ubiquinone] 1 beta subcomplex subunit 1 [Odobenus rosmarus divergens]